MRGNNLGAAHRQMAVRPRLWQSRCRPSDHDAALISSLRLEKRAGKSEGLAA